MMIGDLSLKMITNNSEEMDEDESKEIFRRKVL